MTEGVSERDEVGVFRAEGIYRLGGRLIWISFSAVCGKRRRR